MAGPVQAAAASPLLEREEALREVEGRLRRSIGGHGGFVVVEGRAGLGKTALLDVVVQSARGARLTIAEARATELEQALGFGLVRQLLEPRLRALDDGARERAFGGAAGLARPILASAATDDGATRFALLHGLYWMLVHLSARAPMLVVVDDAQWADEPSREWLHYLERRLEELPVLVLVATRPTPIAPTNGDAAFALGADARAERIVLHPLGADSVRSLVARRVGHDPAPDVTSACHRVTGGNPLLVRELLDTIEARGAAIEEVATEELSSYASDTLVRRTRHRLTRLGPAPTRAADALAILGDGAALRKVAAVAELDLPAAAEAVDALVAADLVGAHRPAAFVHPLLRAAVIDSLAPYERSALHARAADVLLAAHADQESVALHLLAAEPAGRDDHLTVLRRAAALALHRGAPANAAVLLRRALLETADDRQRAGVLRELAEAELREGDPSAVEHLEEVLALSTDARERAVTAHALARALLFQGSWDSAVEQFRAARASLADLDPDLAARIEGDLLTTTILDDRTPPADRPEVTSEEIRALAGRPAGRASALTLALVQTLRGRCADVPDLVRTALANGEFLAVETSDAMAAVHAVDALVFVDELDDALTLARAMVADGERRASVLGVVAGLTHCGLAEYRLGALVDAEADCRAALDLAREHALAFTYPFIASYLSKTLLARGDAFGARAVIESVEPSVALAHTVAVPTFLEARGAALVACGDRVGALGDLRACADATDRLGITNPNVHEWRAGLVEALQVDDPGEAKRFAADNLARAERSGSNRGVGIALRCLAGLGPPSGRAELLRESVRILASSPARAERARSLLELGVIECRHGDRVGARSILLESLQLATECGATKLAERALEEARLAGARPRRAWTTGRAALTPAERRVALLAADGRTNQEIAQSLFVTTKTVKAHLGSVYRKLSISRRAELRSQL